jgi:hypothetical protein
MRLRGQAAWAALLLTALAGVAVAGIRVPLEKVPEPAVKLVKDRFPKATIRFVDKEGKDRFEFAMKEGGRRFDVGVTASGKLLNIKEELAVGKLPADLVKGLAKSSPGARIVEAEKVTTGEGKAARLTYELVIQTAKGKRAVVVDAAGKIVGETD